MECENTGVFNPLKRKYDSEFGPKYNKKFGSCELACILQGMKMKDWWKR
jgi:hypothetical protein